MIDPKVLREAREKTKHSHKDENGRKAWDVSDADHVVGEADDDGSFSITFGEGLGGVSVRVHTRHGGIGYTLEHEGRPHAAATPPVAAQTRRVTVTEPKADLPKPPAKPKRKSAPRKKKAVAADK
jgi:hypothetical protein